MKFVTLLSGGKDSVYNTMLCCQRGHELLCAAHLAPPGGVEEADSYMYQSAGSAALPVIAKCLGVPLIQRTMAGSAADQRLLYRPTEGDEVEELFELLRNVKARFPAVEAVACGAIFSTYQRTRVESVCLRLSLTPLAFLWRRPQSALLSEMLAAGINAVPVKVAALGLNPRRHLGKPLTALQPHFEALAARHGFHVCGEGGEYETLVLDCPLFSECRLVLDETEVVTTDDDGGGAPVGVLRILRCHAESKPPPASPAPPVNGALGAAAAAAAADGGSNGVYELGAHVCMGGIVSYANAADATADAGAGAGAAVLETDEAMAAAQMEDCMAVLAAALAARGLSLEDVVFVHLYLADIRAFAAVNAAYCRRLPVELPPSRSCVEVALPPPHAVMLDCSALRGSGATMRSGPGGCQERQV
ncbi:unnamed protein product, partial [Phaeothamnion confervicola]